MSKVNRASPASAAPVQDQARAEILALRAEVERLRGELADRAAANAALHQKLDFRNLCMDAVPTHFLILERTPTGDRIVYANRSIARDHGYEPEEIIGRDVRILGFEFNSEEERHQLHALLDAGQPISAEGRALRRNGERFWVGFRLVPVRTAGDEITHYVGCGSDITARREADRRKGELQQRLYTEMRERERIAIELRLAHKLESVGRLAAGIAHEINTPIQYVGDSVHFLRAAFEDLARLFAAYRRAVSSAAPLLPDRTVLDEIENIEEEIDFEFLKAETPRAFERTVEGVDRVANVVRAMKEFAHPDTSERNPVDLNHALQTTLEVARGEYKYIASVEVELGELPPVMCNASEINQAFLNLIINAAHAIDDAGRDPFEGRITVTTALDGEYASITVADNGCGIEQENLERVFDPFFTTKEVGRGTGQGLSITRAIIVDRHGGTVDVTSAVGVGTRFTLRLPIAGRGARKEVA